MIAQTSSPLDLSQFDRNNSHLMRKIRILAGQSSPIIQRRPKTSRPHSLAQYRYRRNRFFNRVIKAWKTRPASVDASMSALTALINPWTNWKGESVTLSNFQTFEIYFARIFELWTLNVFDPVTITAINDPWPTDWPVPVDYDSITVDFAVHPPRITVHHITPLPISRGIQLLAYLCGPGKRTATDPFAASLLLWSVLPNAVTPTPNVNKFDLPTETLTYPYQLPAFQMQVAVRPIDGAVLIGTPPKSTLLPYNNFVYRFTLPTGAL